MKVESATILGCRVVGSGALIAVFDCELAPMGIRLKDCKLFQGKENKFICWPTTSYLDKKTNTTKYRKIFEFMTTADNFHATKVILEGVEKLIAEGVNNHVRKADTQAPSVSEGESSSLPF